MNIDLHSRYVRRENLREFCTGVIAVVGMIASIGVIAVIIRVAAGKW